jgi:hypothetical protein
MIKREQITRRRKQKEYEGEEPECETQNRRNIKRG